MVISTAAFVAYTHATTLNDASTRPSPHVPWAMLTGKELLLPSSSHERLGSDGMEARATPAHVHMGMHIVLHVRAGHSDLDIPFQALSTFRLPDGVLKLLEALHGCERVPILG